MSRVFPAQKPFSFLEFTISTFSTIIGVIFILFSISVEADAVNYDNDTSLDFTWEAASGNVDHYNVYSSTDDGEYVLEGTTSETSYTVPGLDGCTYRVKVEAVDAAGNVGPMSEESDPVIVDVTLSSSLTISNACIGRGSDTEVVTPIPITIQNPDSLEIVSCDLTLTYDDSLVEVRPSTLGTLTENAGWSPPTENTPAPGQLAINLVGANPVTTNGTILNLNLVAKDTANRSDITNIEIQSAEFSLSDGSSGSPEGKVNGQVTGAGLWGDSSGDDRITGLDAAFVSQKVVGLMEFSNLQTKCGDVNLDGRLTGLDAAFISKKVVGLFDSLPSSDVLDNATDERLRDSYETPLSSPALSKSVRIEGIQYASLDNPFTVQLDVDNASGILASEISLTYNPDLVKFVGITKTDLTNEFNLVQNTADNKVSICMYDIKNLSGSGSLINFKFIPVRSGSSFDNAITFSKVNLYNETGELNQNWTISTKITPKSYSLLQNYPNPFNPETWIPYQLPKSADVTIRIYDVSGHLVRGLNLGRKSSGLYLDKTKAAYWNGKNNHGEKVSSGIYYYHLEANSHSAIKKMVILK